MRTRWEALTGTAPGKLAITVLIALLGWGCAQLLGLDDLTGSPLYFYLAATLLAVGLYSSTNGIDLREARHNARTVVVAVTIGVGLKALLIAGVMYLVFRRPEYLVLGVAVAQIDPLSVATMQVRSRMSERAKAVLLAWASFDDPITTLLTIYLSGLTLAMLHRPAGDAAAAPGAAASDGTLAAFGTGLVQSIAFAACALLLWLAITRIGVRPGMRSAPWIPATVPPARRRRNVAAIITLTGLAAVAVWQFIMLGLALAGLFFRPALGAWIERLTSAAFMLAAFALGMLLGPGIDLTTGLVLGVAAFAAQIVVSTIITRGHTRDDRVYLALGQQNGITAIILALLLETSFPGTVGIVAPAILVVNLLNIASNAMWDHRGEVAAFVRAAGGSRRRVPAGPRPRPAAAAGPEIDVPERVPSRHAAPVPARADVVPVRPRP